MIEQFFAGLQGLSFWQWIGLILLAAALRGITPILCGSWRTGRDD